jgi:hypothetical protein
MPPPMPSSTTSTRPTATSEPVLLDAVLVTGGAVVDGGSVVGSADGDNVLTGIGEDEVRDGVGLNAGRGDRVRVRVGVGVGDGVCDGVGVAVGEWLGGTVVVAVTQSGGTQAGGVVDGGEDDGATWAPGPEAAPEVAAGTDRGVAEPAAATCATSGTNTAASRSVPVADARRRRSAMSTPPTGDGSNGIVGQR